MDSRDEHEAEVEELARAVAEGAAVMRAWIRTRLARHRTEALSHRVVRAQRTALLHDRACRQRAWEQAEVDRETTRCARRMRDAVAEGTGLDRPAHWTV
ncbi:hypothetical protein LQ327_15125 [Actinomycetospora endophytica]|uniref:Uncharacterized protein n=1 Tax=Actinomycetospora endophytica TaxID=2291215 RepID=A0ABS8P9C5_9PSEU|nr:hypothetical protein [Actinomycetospora endophytica]MCD2194704.1 hypothetical protein [Actinomycetospora endophytica]